MNWNTAKYDAQDRRHSRSFPAQADTQFREFPLAVLDACYNAARKVYADMTAKNAKFKKIYDNYTAFQKDVVQWFQFAEGTSTAIWRASCAADSPLPGVRLKAPPKGGAFVVLALRMFSGFSAGQSPRRPAPIAAPRS